jgi:hypothetical protein
MNLRRLSIGCTALAILTAAALRGGETRSIISAEELLRHTQSLRGKVISVEGFVRFDRLSQRGFLYRNMRELRRRDYHKTIFLELGNENYVSLKIPDGPRVVVTGFLSPDLRGPLGVYPAHIIVDKIQVLRK